MALKKLIFPLCCLTLATLILSPITKADQLYKCGDTWSNSPCKDGASKPVKMKRSLSKVPGRNTGEAELPVKHTYGSELGKKTTLRLVGSPEGTFEKNYYKIRLTSAKVKVKNVGSYPAERIKVYIVMPNGQEEDLEGPRTLKPNQSALYSDSSMYKTVTSAKKLKARTFCVNCRN